MLKLIWRKHDKYLLKNTYLKVKSVHKIHLYIYRQNISREANIFSHILAVTSAVTRLAKAIYEGPRVKATICRRHGPTNKSTANFNLMNTTAASDSCHRDINLSTCLLISVKSRIGGLDGNLLKSRAFGVALTPMLGCFKPFEALRYSAKVFLISIFLRVYMLYKLYRNEIEE